MKDMPKDLESKMTVLKALLKNMYSMMAKKKGPGKMEEMEEEAEEMGEDKEESEDMPSLSGLLASKKMKTPKFSLVSMSVSKKPMGMKKGKM
jgi:hypothetical protein